MTGIQWVLPSLDPAYREECLETMAPAIRERTLVIDNTRHNRGVAASWNLGAERAKHSDADWLVIVSESVRFGDAQGLDLEAELRRAHDPWIDTQLGWHLVAFKTRTLERVGAFDENFWPAYLEDTDYLTRLHLAGYPSPRENDREHRWLMHLDAHDTGTEHSLRAGLVQVDLGRNRQYYREKWGADEPGHRYTTPFGRDDVDWTWWPEPVSIP